MVNLHLALKAGVSELARGLALVGDALRGAGVDEAACFRSELVLEEIVTNVFRHGQFDDAALPCIDVCVRADAEAVELTFVDACSAFDPRHHLVPQGDGSLAGAPPGGRGLLLVRKAATQLDYERQDGRNHLRVRIARTLLA